MCVLLIGNNNMFFTPETGIEPVAQGIKMCVDNLREKFPQTPVIVVKIFPAHTPGNPFYEDIKKVNAALDKLDLERDPKVRVLDIWGDMVNADSTLKKELFTPDNIHLSQAGGYKLYAEKLKPMLESFLAGKEVPQSVPRTYAPSAPAVNPSPKPAVAPEPSAQKPSAPKSVATNVEPAQAKQVIYDDQLSPGWINNPIHATVTLDSSDPAGNGSTCIAVKSEPYGGFQVLRWGTALDTTLCKSISLRIHGGEKGGQNLRIAMMNGLAEGPRWQIVPVPKAGAWTKFSMALSDLGVAESKNLYGLRIWEAGGANASYFLDDIQLSDEEALRSTASSLTICFGGIGSVIRLLPMSLQPTQHRFTVANIRLPRRLPVAAVVLKSVTAGPFPIQHRMSRSASGFMAVRLVVNNCICL